MQLFWTLILLAALAIAGCEQVDTGTAPPPASGTAQPHAAGPPPVRIVNVDRYYSLYSHGPTLRVYVFRDDRAVLKLTFSNETRETTPQAMLYEFAPAVSEEAIGKWINNQHSDALYPDAAEPLEAQDVIDKLTLLSWRETGQSSGQSGETYATMEVRYTVDQIVTDRLTIDPFTDMAIVHVMTDKGQEPAE